jgi:hypothetical protein
MDLLESISLCPCDGTCCHESLEQASGILAITPIRGMPAGKQIVCGAVYLIKKRGLRLANHPSSAPCLSISARCACSASRSKAAPLAV